MRQKTGRKVETARVWVSCTNWLLDCRGSEKMWIPAAIIIEKRT